MARTCPASDLISYLPDNVIENILTRLPLKQAVKTSVLSKKWRYNWVSIPFLVFDDSTLGVGKCLGATRNELLMIIHQVLLLQQGPILKFTLSLFEMESCPEIDHLVSFLSRKGIQELTLKIWKGQRHRLPFYLFSCLQLSHLSLHRCVLMPDPPTFEGFKNLKTIEFFKTNLTSDFAESFISKCPLLERLTLHGCSDLRALHLDAPNLKFLDFAGSVVTSVRFSRAPLLEKVSIENTGTFFAGCRFAIAWIRALWSLPALCVLDCGRLIIPFIIWNRWRLSLPSNLSIGILVLPEFCHEPDMQISFTLCLIRSCCNLRKLTMMGFSSARNIEEESKAAKEIQSQDFSDMSLNLLQEVEILSSFGTQYEMEMIKLLLAKASVLETFHIHHSRGRTAKQKLTTLEKVVQFQRASPRAQVIFS